MAGEWREYRIGEISDIIGGSTPSTADPSNFNGEIPWLTPKDLSGPHERYVSRGERNLSRKGLEGCSAQLLPAGTVLLTSRAPIGYVAIAKTLIATNQGFRNLVPKSGFSSEFLYYWLKAHVAELQRHASGSTFQELSGSALAEIKIRVPPLPEQRAIAHILGTLDDKIELNRRMSETLERMAQALFKSWFVDFDPVVVNALRAGNPLPEKFAKRAAHYRENPDALGLPDPILRLFPARFVDSELGEIPEGWEVAIMGNQFRIVMGQSPPGSTYNESRKGSPFYQGRVDFSYRFPQQRVFCTAPTRFAQDGDTLVSVRAPVGSVNMAVERCAIGRGVAAVRHLTGSRSYTYYFVRSLKKIFENFEAEGTVFGAINKDGFNSIKCVVPPIRLVERFDALCKPLDDKIERNERESRTLAALRDALLPGLISGQLRVKDAERFLEERGL